MEQESVNNCINCKNQSYPFKVLNSKELKLLGQNCNIVSFDKGELIFKQGTPSSHVIYIRKGFIKISNKNKNNKNLIIRLVQCGNYIGLPSIFGDNIYNYSAVAIENSEICLIGKDIFLKIIEENGVFAKKIIEYNCKNELLSTNRIVSLIHKQVPGRFADMLLYLSKDIYNNLVFSFPLSRDELANFIGTSKKSFIRTLNEFKADGLINLNGREIEIVRMDLIERLSLVG